MGLLTLLDSLRHRVRGWTKRALTLDTRAFDLTLETRVDAYTLGARVNALTLETRATAYTLAARTCNLTLEDLP